MRGDEFLGGAFDTEELVQSGLAGNWPVVTDILRWGISQFLRQLALVECMKT